MERVATSKGTPNGPNRVAELYIIIELSRTDVYTAVWWYSGQHPFYNSRADTNICKLHEQY